MLLGLTQPKRKGLSSSFLKALKLTSACRGVTRGCSKEQLPAKLSLAAAAVLHSGLADAALRLAQAYRTAKDDVEGQAKAVEACPSGMSVMFARVANETMKRIGELGASTAPKALPVVIARARLLLSAAVVFPRGGMSVWSRVRAAFLHFAGLSPTLRAEIAARAKAQAVGTAEDQPAMGGSSAIESSQDEETAKKVAEKSGGSLHTALRAVSSRRQA